MIGIFVLITFQSFILARSIRVPYIKGMLLGRTFDYSKSLVGNDIFTGQVRNNAVQRKLDKTDLKYKIVRGSEDIRNVLDVSGQLSLKVMGGAVDLEGKGSYLKSSVESGNSVEVLVHISYRTVTKTITDDNTPVANWDKKNVVGIHYIRSMTYGGELVASLKFTAKQNRNREEIKASISGSLNVGIKVSARGQFEKIATSASQLSTLTISYSSTTIPDRLPIDLNAMLTIIDEFPKEVKKVGGIGVPIEVEIRELSYLTPKPEFTFEKSGVIGHKIVRLTQMFHDMRVTLDAIVKSLRNAKIGKNQETVYGAFYDKIMKIHGNFSDMIENIDLNARTANGNQFDAAFLAYKEGKVAFLYGQFRRQFERILKEHPPSRGGITTSSKYNQKVQKLKKEIGKLTKEINTFKNLLSGSKVKIVFPQQGITDYMIDKGAPEMDSIMVCFSTETNSQTSIHFLSYAVTGSNNEFLILNNGNNMQLTVKGSTKDLGNLNMNDGTWHSWCIYWDDSGTTKAFKDGSEAASHTGLSTGSKITAGGTWVIGQDQDAVGGSFVAAQSLTGKITNVNIYGNFDRSTFKNTVAPTMSSNKCAATYNQNMIKTWDDFKLGFVGKYANVKTATCPTLHSIKNS